MPPFPDVPSPPFGEASVAFRANTQRIHSGLADTQSCLDVTEALLSIPEWNQCKRPEVDALHPAELGFVWFTM